jgi:tRNA U34 5-methylaminomethyl-2-thiouridine-forming methyltransferase MnmC
LEREIIKTLDGSTTIQLKEWNECYHSKHGAIQEAKHVFINNGLSLFANQSVSILEIGFGTGLNAFVTFLDSHRLKQTIHYVGIDAYPVTTSEALKMNYVTELNASSYEETFIKMHESKWGEKVILSSNFELFKRKQFFHEIDDIEQFDLIYFDAFGYRVQPELWSTQLFKQMFDALRSGGKLVTYAARGDVKRSMLEVGFLVEKLQGPPGKREMTRATKP